MSYPFGVAGPILLLYLAFMIFKPKIDTSAGAGLDMLEIALRNPDLFGKTLGEVMSALPADVKIVALRTRRITTSRPRPGSSSRRTTSCSRSARQGVARQDAQACSARRRPAACSRTAATSTTSACSLRARAWWAARSATSTCRARRRRSSRRSGAATPTSCRAPTSCSNTATASACSPNRADFPALREFFGDSIKGTAEFSYISIGLGMALGFLLGAIQIPLPGIGKLSLGLSGVLIVALVLGNLRRTGGMNWTIPLSANLVLRNLGLTLFLAQVGMSSGPKFAATVTDTGLLMLGLGAIVLLALAVPVLLLGLLVYRMPFDEVAGIVSGACGNPAILAFANKITPTDRPDIGYAMIFPGMTIVKILFVDIVAALF